MKKYIPHILVVFFCLLSLFLNVYNKQQSPPSFNADEASFGYNAYSLLKTGRDEYGALLPLRLKSFGDYKMPLYSYLSVPIMALFGLSEFSSRFLNTILSAFFPLVIYFLTKELFSKKPIALLASFLVSISLGLHIVGRHAHEAYLSAFLTTLSLYLFIKIIHGSKKILHYVLFFSIFFLSLFSYQSNRIIAFIYFVLIIVYMVKKLVSWKVLLGLVILAGIFSVTDFMYAPKRVSNLLFFNTPGFTAGIRELKNEVPIPSLHRIYNPITYGLQQELLKYIDYFSPQFLVTRGDQNYRFGYPGMSPMTNVEYIFIYVGIMFLCIKKEKNRFILLAFFFISPLTGSLSWADPSLTRTLFFLIPCLILSSYGMYVSWITLQKIKWFRLTSLSLVLFFFLLVTASWTFYLFHYPKRGIVIRAWQGGYRELTDIIREKYASKKKIYISREHGMPYIFMLFYLQYPPGKYQKQSSLSAPDEYGFGQVENFDKFVFDFLSPAKDANSLYIAYPHDFQSLPGEDYDPLKITRVTANKKEDVFWMYEN